MAIKISGTTVVDDSRVLSNITALDANTTVSIQNAVGGGASIGEIVGAYRGLSNSYYSDSDYMPTFVYAGDFTDGYVNPYTLGIFDQTEASEYFTNVMGSQTIADIEKSVTFGTANTQGATLNNSWAQSNTQVYLEKSSNGSVMHAYRNTANNVSMDRFIVGVGWVYDEYVRDFGTDTYPALTHYNDQTDYFVVLITDTNYSTTNRYQWKTYGANASNYTIELNDFISSGIGKIKAACVADGSSLGGTYHYFAIGEGGISTKSSSGSASSLQSQIVFNGQSLPFDTTNAQYIDHLTYVSSNATHITLKGLDFGYNGNASKGTSYTLVFSPSAGTWEIDSDSVSTIDGATNWNTYTSTETFAYHYDTIRSKYFFSMRAGGYDVYNCVSDDGYTWTRQQDIRAEPITSIKCDTNYTYMLGHSACNDVIITTSDYSTYNIDIDSPGLGSYKADNQRHFFGFDSYYAGDYFNDNNGWLAYDNASTVYRLELPVSRTGSNTGLYVILDGYSYDTSTEFYAQPTLNAANTLFQTPTSSRSFVKVK